MSPLIAALHTPDREALERLLGESVRFHSPVAEYDGRRDVSHLLSLIAGVLSDVRPTRELAAASTYTTFFDAAVGERPVQGVLDERRDESGRVVEATLMLRPLSALKVAVAAMAEALEADPLPGRGL